MINKNKLTPAQRKLVNFLYKRDPSLREKDVIPLLNNIKRFVNLARKIYTEPQATFLYNKNLRIEKKYKKFDLVIKTDIKEIGKVLGKNKSAPLSSTLKTFMKEVSKKNGR